MRMSLANEKSKKKGIVPSLRQLNELIPHTVRTKKVVSSARKKVIEYLNGKMSRGHLLAIVGPCAVHNPMTVLQYAKKLAELAKKISSHITVIMRVNGEKPRTKKSWDGYALDPMFDGTHMVNIGFYEMRKLMHDINDLELPVATEALIPTSFNVLSDMVSYAWIGARNVSDTNSRQLASGISMPVGIKNSTDSPLSTAVNAIDFANQPGYMFVPDEDNIMDIHDTDGNPCPHLILRGNGHGPNYDSASIKAARQELLEAGLIDRVIVDCSHGNCGGHYHKQKDVLMSLVDQIMAGEDGIAGFMMESYLKAGKQKVDNLGTKSVNINTVDPEQSITDACLSWEETESALLNAYAELKKIR